MPRAIPPPGSRCSVPFWAGLASVYACTAFGADLPPADTNASTVIDTCIAERHSAAGVTPAPVIDDGAFLRRVTLDLAGRIPTSAETREFVAMLAADKRTQLVDQLLASADFAFHQRNELDLLLLARIERDDDWRAYLLDAVRENRSWDRLFREVLLPERERPGDKGAAAFLRERVRELDDLTNDTAALFFGVNVSCAKCHDHPLVEDWKQQHYFGMASFFKRTYRTKQGLLAERFDGRLKFNTTSGEEHDAQFMFLTGVSIEEPQAERTDEERKQIEAAIKRAEKEDNADAPPLPDFSPRTELVRLALEDRERDFLARNMVNRTWARLTGRGLVHPLDQMHSANPPSHPELLAWLARDFAANGYDLKRLIRGIVLSETYARDSRWNGAGDFPPPELFAVGAARPLTPRQFALSLNIATADPEQLPGLEKPDYWPQRREALESQSQDLAGRFEIPDDNFQVSVDEALLFSNDDRIQNDALRDAGDRLVGRLKSIGDDGAAVAAAFEAVLSRAPTADEQAAFAGYLGERGARRVEGIQQVVWALVTSPEFRFSH
jgi:hypothetical protein